MKCPKCKKELKKTGMDLFVCPKCHNIFHLTDSELLKSIKRLTNLFNELADDFKKLGINNDK